MKIVSPITQWIFVLVLPLLLITASIGLTVNSQWLYESGFEKYNVGRTTGLADAELETAARGLIGYFNSGEDAIFITVVKDGQPFTLFNEREVAHLRDVKGLIRLNYRILLGTGIYVLAYAGVSLSRRKNRGRLAWGLAGGGGVTLGLILVLGLAAMMDFDYFFRQFHLIGFANDLWLLSPGASGLMRQR
jgi:integral membrane protein (TIGR01906 family)